MLYLEYISIYRELTEFHPPKFWQLVYLAYYPATGPINGLLDSLVKLTEKLIY